MDRKDVDSDSKEVLESEDEATLDIFCENITRDDERKRKKKDLAKRTKRIFK